MQDKICFGVEYVISCFIVISSTKKACYDLLLLKLMIIRNGGEEEPYTGMSILLDWFSTVNYFLPCNGEITLTRT